MNIVNDKSLQSIITSHLAGDIIQAESDYRRWLDVHDAAHPLYADCLHYLGVLLIQRSDTAMAREYLQKAVSLRREPLWLVNLAATCCDCGAYQEAEQLCKEALQVDDSIANLHFILGDIAREKNNLPAAIQYYRKALAIQPHHRQAGVNLAAVLQDNGQIQAALHEYRRILAQFPDDAIAQHNYRTLMSKQLPAWHFPMLADHERNILFQRALEKVVTPETVVLDIGTGSGLLAMMAARAGAKCVTACEFNTAVAEIARTVVADNGFNNIAVINKKSTALTVGADGDIQDKADVLVAEIVDAGLLGEGILPTFRHAQRTLLKDNARIIPSGAVVYAQLVQLPRMYAVNPVNNIEGFDLKAFDQFRVSNAPVLVDLNHEPCIRLSAPIAVAHFDFRNIPVAGEHALPSVDVVIEQEGYVDAIVYWFDLQLDDNINLSTSPDSAIFCWQQSAIFFSQRRLAKVGASLQIKVAHNDAQMFFAF